MKKVWLFSRMNTFTGNENLKNLMDKCREEAFKKGYTVVDETIVIGSSDLAKAAVKDIIEHNSQDNGAEAIFSINGNSLSGDLKTAQEIYEYITSNGLIFETAHDDSVLLDKNTPVGAVFNLLATGQKQLPADFPFEDQEEGLEPDEHDICGSINSQSM